MTALLHFLSLALAAAGVGLVFLGVVARETPPVWAGAWTLLCWGAMELGLYAAGVDDPPARAADRLLGDLDYPDDADD